ncbi:hypothetical protein Hanom_Chr04g00373051 [Helianthus anomalus]
MGGMGFGLGHGLGKTSKPPPWGLGLGLGFGRGPFGVGLKPGVGRASKVICRAFNGMCQLMPPNPSPTIPHGRVFFSHSTCQPMPNPSSTIPHGLNPWWPWKKPSNF